MAELEATLSLDELAEWKAFDKVDPIGGYRGDLQAAMIALMQSQNAEAKLSDFLVIDPHPMTNEQREHYEQLKVIEEVKRSAQRTINMFEQLDKDN